MKNSENFLLGKFRKLLFWKISKIVILENSKNRQIGKIKKCPICKIEGLRATTARDARNIGRLFFSQIR